MSESVQVVKKSLNDLFGVGGDTKVATFAPTSNTPEYEYHAFPVDLIHLGVAWMHLKVKPNLLLLGHTGTGKSSFIEQFCNRIGQSVYRVGCHGRLEFGELLGGWRLVLDQVTNQVTQKWFDGPLIRAMEEGGVLLLDEGNFLDPSVVGGLNGVLDGTPVYIPETNRLIHPHANFRMAMTGNPVDPKYKGVKKFNIAMLDRWLVGSVDYLSEIEESAIINAVIPKMEGWIIELLVKTANSVRQQFKADEFETTISTRGIIAWAKMLKVFRITLSDAVQTNNSDEAVKIICKALDMAITNRSPEEERQAIHLLVKNSFRIPV